MFSQIGGGRSGISQTTWTNERLLRPHLRNRGAPAPRGAGADRARPPGSPPHWVTLHARRSDPEATAKWRQRRARRNLACMPESPTRAEPRTTYRTTRDRGRSGGLTPPPQAPRSRAETSATSAERRRTRPTSGGGRSGISQTTWICYRIWVGLLSDTFPNVSRSCGDWCVLA